jgi:opacity protein-like surface antigen
MKRIAITFGAIVFSFGLAAQDTSNTEEESRRRAEMAKEQMMKTNMTGGSIMIEGSGTFALAAGKSDYVTNGVASTSATTYDSKNIGMKGFGGGANVGYEFIPGLMAIASYRYSSLKTREFTNSYVAAATSLATIQSTIKLHMIGIGLRPSVNAFGGEIFAGAGFLVILPTKLETAITYTGGTLASVSAVTSVTDNYNLGLGGYGELGYKYKINENLSAGIGIRLNIGQSSNNNKDTTTTTTSTSGSTTSTVTHKDSGATESDATKSGYDIPSTIGLNTLSAEVLVSYKI